jgi:hypothetical protein
MEFLPEHWSIIKSYAGIYHLRTDWNLMKLDNRAICVILSMVAPNCINMDFTCNEERMKCIWKYLHKKKLYDVNKFINDLIDPYKSFRSRSAVDQNINLKRKNLI